MPLLAPAPDPELSGAAAIVGVGESNYGADYAAARDRSRTIEPSSLESLYRTAFQRALADAGVQRSDVDGVIGSVSYGALGADTVAKSLDLEPRFLAEGIGMMLGVVPAAVAALTARRCDVVALVYGALSRGTGREFGGQTYTGNGRDSYYYYHPWRWSSQAAHWAMMFQHYAAAFGVTEASLGSVATTLRAHAARNTNAIMRSPMTVEDYLETRYIVRPLRLFDLCLVNDGAVCLIMCRSDRAADGPHAAVHVSGWADVEVATDKMRRLVVGGLRDEYRRAGDEAFDMAGLDRSAVDHFQGYDASSIHLVCQLEGYGFAPAGVGIGFFEDGQASIGGKLPVNTSGGMLSEAYMHGWNHVVEAVRQLRHEAGERQLPDARVSLFSMATTQSAHPLILTRPA